MKTSTTADRLRNIMKMRNIKQVDIIDMAQPYCKQYGIKLNKNDLSQYVNGKNEPGQHKLSILGMALNVSEAWLMGYDVPMEREIAKEKEPSETPLDDTDQLLLRLCKLLTPEQKQLVLKKIVEEMEASKQNQ